MNFTLERHAFSSRLAWARRRLGDLVGVAYAFGGRRKGGQGDAMFYGRSQREADMKARRWAQRRGAR
jgi:hypothetical protein